MNMLSEFGEDDARIKTHRIGDKNGTHRLRAIFVSCIVSI